MRDLLPMRDCIGLMQTAFERLASGEAINQPRRRLILPTGSVLHYMAASDGQYYGAKIYDTIPRYGAHFLFLLYRAADAEPLAIIEANHSGQIRTGAASGLATSFMAREGAKTPGHHRQRISGAHAVGSLMPPLPSSASASGAGRQRSAPPSRRVRRALRAARRG